MIMSSLFTPNNVPNGYALVSTQQSIPIFLAYGIIPCVIFKLHIKEPLSSVGIKRSRSIFISVIEVVVFVSFWAYL
jgi:hypothetical protein